MIVDVKNSQAYMTNNVHVITPKSRKVMVMIGLTVTKYSVIQLIRVIGSHYTEVYGQ
jgi:hypothetical protein